MSSYRSELPDEVPRGKPPRLLYTSEEQIGIESRSSASIKSFLCPLITLVCYSYVVVVFLALYAKKTRVLLHWLLVLRLALFDIRHLWHRTTDLMTQLDDHLNEIPRYSSKFV